MTHGSWATNRSWSSISQGWSITRSRLKSLSREPVRVVRLHGQSSRPTSTHQNRWYTWLLPKFQPRSKPHSIGKTLGHSKHNWTSPRHHWNPPPGCKCLDIIARATKTLAESRHRGPLLFDSKTGSKTLLMCQRHSQNCLA